MPNKQEDHVLVRQRALEKLKCFYCEKYLSILPIHLTPAGNPICGRCPLPDETCPRNVVYENVIEYYKFPCANCDSGCPEVDVPSKMAEHEDKCTYKKHKCPWRADKNDCTWEGRLNEIAAHFEKQHPTFVLKEFPGFELDLVNIYKEYYLMPFEDDLYEITSENSSDAGTFAITVCPLGSLDRENGDTYEFTLESVGKTYKCSMQEKLGNRRELNRSCISQLLNEPSTIVIRIRINKNSTALASPKFARGQETDGRGRINYDELRIVECPVCFHYMVSPIYQCASGHNICDECMPTQESCPICRSNFIETRNLGLETLMMKRTYPCRYQGCQFTAIGEHIKEHEADCLYRPIDCPLKDYAECDRTFLGFKLFDHIRHAHREYWLDGDTISITFEYCDFNDGPADIIETYITRRYQMLFKICFKYDNQEDTLFWAVQMVGSNRQRAKYYFELEIIDNNGNDLRLYVKGNCAPLNGIYQSFSDGKYFVRVYWHEVGRFIKYIGTDETLTYRILIKEKM